MSAPGAWPGQVTWDTGSDLIRCGRCGDTWTQREPLAAMQEVDWHWEWCIGVHRPTPTPPGRSW